MQAPPSTLSCAALALWLFHSLPPMPITSQYSRRGRTQLSQLSGEGIFQQRTPNAEYRGEPWVSPSDITADFRHCQAGSRQFRSQYFSASKSSIKRAEIFSLYFPESPRHKCIPWWALFWRVEIRWTPSLNYIGSDAYVHRCENSCQRSLW